MSLIDLILNLAALLLWLNWRAIDFATISSPRVSIVSNLKRLNRSPSRWIFFVILLAVLLGRAVIYRQLGAALDWVAAIPLGPTTLHFRSDNWGRILLFSFLSFGVVLGIFYMGFSSSRLQTRACRMPIRCRSWCDFTWDGWNGCRYL